MNKEDEMIAQRSAALAAPTPEMAKPVSGRQIVNSRRAHREAPGPHFKRVAEMWSAIIGYRITAPQVVLMMAALKIAREAGGHDEDNMVDAEGYSSIYEEVYKHWSNGMELLGCELSALAASAKSPPPTDPNLQQAAR